VRRRPARGPGAALSVYDVALALGGVVVVMMVVMVMPVVPVMRRGGRGDRDGGQQDGDEQGLGHGVLR